MLTELKYNGTIVDRSVELSDLCHIKGGKN